MTKKKEAKKQKLSGHQKSFQQNFLHFSKMQNGVVEFKEDKRIYLHVKPINTSLMKLTEKEDLIEELGTVFSTLDNVEEIAIHVLDKQADVYSNIELVRSIQEKSDNTYVQAYMTEQEKELLEANENGAERSFFICLIYSKMTETEEILAEAKQLTFIDSKFKLSLMEKQDVKKVYNVYTTRDFTDEISVGEYIVEKYQKGDEADVVAFKNAMSPLRSKFAPSYAQIGDLHVKTFVIRKYPQNANKLILFEHLSKLNGIDITIRLNKIDDSKIAAGIDKTINAAQQKTETANKETDRMESRKKQEELAKMYQRMLEENEGMYYISIFFQIKAFSTEELNTLEKRLQRALSQIAFVKEAPQLLQREAWFAAAPFGKNQLSRLVRRNVPLSTAACIMPFVYSGRKDNQGQVIGEDNVGGKMLVDFEKKDTEVTNTNIAIIGESGQGKTRLEHMIMFQKFARGNRLFIEDPEREHSSFVEKLGGTYIQPGGKYKINPLEVFDFGQADEDDDKTLYFSQTSSLRQHIGWLTEFFKEYNSQINTDLTAILLEKFYIKNGYSFLENIQKTSEETPILSDFYNFITEEIKQLKKQEVEERILIENVTEETKQHTFDFIDRNNVYVYKVEELEKLLQEIHSMCIGSDSDLCNGKTNMASSKVVAWDLNDLLAGSKRRLRIVQHLIGGYVWNQVVKHRYSDKVTYIISELSLRLNKDNVSSIITIVGMLKRFRKYESDMIVSTQNPYDMLREGLREYTAPLFTSPSFRFLFYPGDGNAEQFMKTVNITETEYSKISRSKKGNVLFTAGATKYNVQISRPTATENTLYGKGGGL